MNRWTTLLALIAAWLLTFWLSPSWLAGWLVALGLPILLTMIGWRIIPQHGPKAVAGWAFLILVAMPLAGGAVFLYVPGSFEWFGAHVMPTYETIKQLFTTETVKTIVWWIFLAFFLPPIWLVGKASELAGFEGNAFAPPLGYVLLPLAVIFSLVFWSVAISRSLKFIGLWSPFWRTNEQGPRWILKSIVRLAEYLEIRQHFGRGPTSAWAGVIEVISERYSRGGIFLGRPKLMLRPIGIPTEKHMVTIASSGSGKSTAALVPNLCLHPGSLLCVDPKGELATITARRRGAGGNGVEGLGQKVCVLDPFGIVQGWTTGAYNVFDEMERVAASDVGALVNYADLLTEALILEVAQKDPFWDDAAKNLLKGLILYVFAAEPPERRNLVRLRQLLMEGDLEAFKRAEDDGSTLEDDTPFTILLEKMRVFRAHPHFGHVISGAAETIGGMPPNVRGSVFATARTHTNFLDLPEFQRISKHSDFLLEDLKTQPLSVYLCLPINMVRGLAGRWLRMFVVLFIDMMQREAKAPNPPVMLMIDEFPSLGPLKNINDVAPLLRSYGVRFWAAAQDVGQLKAVYDKSWEGFVGNAEAVQFMGVTHPTTVEFVVKLLGSHMVSKRVPNTGGPPQKITYRAPLLDADQVGRLLAKERKNQIVWRGSRRPMLLKITPYWEYLPSWYYDADPRYPETLRRRFWRAIVGPGTPSSSSTSQSAAQTIPAGTGHAPAAASSSSEGAEIPSADGDGRAQETPRWADIVAEQEEGASSVQRGSATTESQK